MRFHVLPGLVMLLGLAGCSTVLVEAPPNQPDPVTLPPVEASVVSIPVSLDLDVLREEALKRIPSPLVSDTTTQVMRINFNPGGPATEKPAVTCSVTSLNCLANKASAIGRAVSIDYTAPVETQITYQAFLRDLSMRMSGNQFTVTSQIEFSVASKMQSSLTQFGIASCGINEAMPRVEFTLPGTVGWGPTGDLAITPGKWSMKWIRPCNITAFRLNVESMLNLPLVREKVETAITEAINGNMRQLGLRAALAKAWGPMNEPREVHPDVWLVLNPEKVGLADLAGTGRMVTTGLMVRARPVVVSGSKPVVKAPPIPAPERVPMSEGFHVAVRSDISLDKANQLLNEQLAGKPIAASGHTVYIEKLRIYGSGSRAVIGLTLSQPIKGEIYALAKPVFDVEKNEVRFESIDFSLATSSFLAKTANWMLHGTFRAALEKQARFSFDTDLADALKDFRNYRQDLGNGLVLRASLDRVKPQGLYFTEKDLKAFLVLDGKLWLDVARMR